MADEAVLIETKRERRLRQKRESEARRRTNRRDDVLAQKRAETTRNRESYRRRQQEWRAAHPEAHAEQQRKQWSDPVKRRAWKLAKKIPLGPCSVCGTAEDVHRHHPDHSKPLEVVMLCRTHHAEEHRRAG